MKAFGKILGLCVLGLLLIIVALGFALTHLFDPNDYKDEIRQLARDKARVELTLNGDIGWSLFPWLGLELHDASVATLNNPKQPFADLQMLGLSVRVLPLLRREVQMSDIRVEGLNLKLVRDESGHGNWQDIGKPLAPAAAASAPDVAVDHNASAAQPQPAQEHSSRVVKLDIDSLTINNASVHYSDIKSGQELTADSIQLSTGGIHENTDIPLKLTAFLGTNQPVVRARTELAGELRIDRKTRRYQFEDMRLSGEVSGDPLQGNTVSYAAQGQLLLDLGANVAEWSGLKFSANQLRALGELNVRNLDSDPQLSGGLSIAQFDLRTFLESAGQTLPAMAAADSLRSVELVARLQGTKNSLALEDLNLKLDGGSYSGRVAVDDFGKKALRVTLQGDKLDADRYLPPRSADAASAAAARKTEVQESEAGAIAGAGTTPLPDKPSHVAWSNDRLLPIQLLRELDLQADLSLGQLTLQQLPIQNAALKLQAAGGLLTLDQLSGGLYNGSFQSHALLDVRPEQPLLAIQTKLDRVPIERFIKTQNPNPPMTGLLTLDSDLQGRGNSQKALIDSLGGKANFSVSNGVLVNANLEQQMCQGIAMLNRKNLTSEPRGKDTPFQQLKGSLVFNNGVASNQDFTASVPGLTINGNGDIDLRVLGMDYRIGVVLQGDLSDTPDPACQVNQNFVGLAFPLRCRGPLELGAKACRVDKEALMQLATKTAAERIGDKLQDKLQDKLGDKVPEQLKDTIKGLFKR
ncbi:AsmA family protein [Pseudomonas sp. HR96]|uniref:AsmA family protein n=1 Tax=Pseudomonas sp. HR96 TaxID=1027966 RepID=UPI002A758440|nr:AsmA family protein [Pseudomonas sp. HR96]WPO99674.1 AsmA family protein [Pseudomonas sp. HR96]